MFWIEKSILIKKIYVIFSPSFVTVCKTIFQELWNNLINPIHNKMNRPTRYEPDEGVRLYCPVCIHLRHVHVIDEVNQAEILK